MVDIRKSPAARYAPALALAGVALALAAHIWTGGPSADPRGAQSSSISTPAAADLKSPYRQQRERLHAASRRKAKTTTLDPITVEEAERIIADAADYGANSRMRIVKEVILRLCASSHLDAAFAIILREPAGGRTGAVMAFFETADEDEKTLMARVPALGNKEDVTAALEAYLTRVPLADLDDFITAWPALHPHLPDALAVYLHRKLSPGPDRQHAMAIISGLHERKLVADNILLRKLVEDTATDPFLRFKELNTRIDRENPDFLSAVWKLTTEMTEKHPVMMAEMALKKDKPTENEPTGVLLRTVLKDWARKDPDAAAAWYDGNQTSFSAVQQDAAAWSFALAASDARDGPRAADWLERVRDPAIKQRLSRLLAASKLDFGR